MTGGLLQLAAYGPQDLYLTGNPQITFFIAVYKRHTNFAIEQIRQYFHGNINFGNKMYCNVDPKGDLVHEMFLNIKLPALNEYPDQNPDYHVSYVNSIGHAIIQNIDVEIGGSLMDRHYGQWLEIWNDLTITSEKRHAYNQMIGKVDNYTLESLSGELNLYIPLQFWFNRNIGLSLPLIALQNSQVRIVLTLRKFDELWVSSNNVPPGLGLQNDSSVMDTKDIIAVTLWVDYIFLENKERKKFAQCSLEYLIEQLQVNTQSLDEKDSVLNMSFSNPVKEIIWVIQTSNIFDRGPEKGFDAFDFSNGEDPPGDTITLAKIQIEGNDLFTEREPIYFRIIQPYQHHTNVPKNFIYVYSFAYKPENHQPTSTCNFSRIDNATLNLVADDCIIQKNSQINIYATNYNVLRIEGGIAGIIYSD
jgi:hypothetical protein